MEDFFYFVGIIIIVFSVLQVILFFKIWGMTNNTKKIKNVIQINEYPSGISPAKLELVLGNIEKAQDMAKKDFICEVYKLYIYISKLDSLSNQEYTERFNNIEKKYKKMFDSTPSFIEFEKFSTYEKAKEIFN